MLRKTVALGISVALMVALAGCSTILGFTKGSSQANKSEALPMSFQLLVGTLLLEDTPHAVTAEQARELLPLWQMLRALQGSGTAAQVEIEAVLNQIQATMTPEQLAAIKDMQLSPTNMREIAQKLGLGRSEEGAGQGGVIAIRPPAGLEPPGGMGPGGMMALGPEAQATVIAERMSSGFGKALMDRLIKLLETRAGGKAEKVAPSPISPTAPETPVAKPKPFTDAFPSPAEALVATATPTPVILANTAPPETKVMAVVISQGLHVRSGPDINYPILGDLKKGDMAEVVGLHPASGWLQIVFEGTPGGKGWVSGKGDYVKIVGPLEKVPVVEAPPLPTPISHE